MTVKTYTELTPNSNTGKPVTIQGRHKKLLLLTGGRLSWVSCVLNLSNLNSLRWSLFTDGRCHRFDYS